MLIEVIDDFWTQLFLRCRSIELKKKKKVGLIKIDQLNKIINEPKIKE